MHNCGIRNGGIGHALALKLSLAGINFLNHLQIIKYILYFKTESFKKHISNASLNSVQKLCGTGFSQFLLLYVILGPISL